MGIPYSSYSKSSYGSMKQCQFTTGSKKRTEHDIPKYFCHGNRKPETEQLQNNDGSIDEVYSVLKKDKVINLNYCVGYSIAL